MYILYQVGDVPLYSYTIGRGDAITFEVEDRSRVPTTTFDGSSWGHFTGPVTHSLRDIPELKSEGVIQGLDIVQARHIRSGLSRWAGRLNVPIIILQWEESSRNDYLTEIEWLLADAVVEPKDIEYKYASDDPQEWSYVSLAVEIEMKLMTPFRRLLPHFWEYREYETRIQNPYSENAAQWGPVTEFQHPNTMRDLRERYYFIEWREPSTMLDPNFWGIKFDNQVTGGQARGYGDFEKIFYYSDPNLWNDVPQPFYAFTGLSNLGEIRIEIQATTGAFAGQQLTDVSCLDLAQLDTDLIAAGFGGISPSDEIFTGAIFPFPGYVKRNDVILSGVKPAWIYPRSYPGEIPTGAGEIKFVQFLSDGQVAYNLDFGMV